MSWSPTWELWGELVIKYSLPTDLPKGPLCRPELSGGPCPDCHAWSALLCRPGNIGARGWQPETHLVAESGLLWGVGLPRGQHRPAAEH